MTNLLKKKGVNFILNCISILTGIIALICYLVSGKDQSEMTETALSAVVYVPLIIAILLNVAGIFLKTNLVKIAAFAIYFLSLVFWIYNQAGYIVNVFMGLDGNSFSFAYILSVICILASLVLSLLAAIRFKKKEIVVE